MSSKPVQALAGLVLVGLSLTGCRSDSGYGGSSGAPQMIGGGTVQPNVVGSRQPMPNAGAYSYGAPQPAGNYGSTQPVSIAAAYGSGTGTPTTGAGLYPSNVSAGSTGYAMPAGSTSAMTPSNVMTPASAPVGYTTSTQNTQVGVNPASYGGQESPAKPVVTGTYTVPGNTQPAAPSSGYSNYRPAAGYNDGNQ